MLHPLPILTHAFRLWWGDAVGLVLLNFVWFLLQLPIVTGPPATAVVYAITRRVHDNELWGISDIRPLLRELFWPAWQWALVNGLFWGITAVNFATYSDRGGPLWLILRLLWGGLALIWLLLNFFYWPFWLAQTDRSMKNTYLNCGRFLLLNSIPSLILVGVATILTLVSLATTLPFALALLSWLALMGVTAVQTSLDRTDASGDKLHS
jgi:hypothetical protein